MSDIFETLKSTKFSSLCFNSKKQIIENGRPMPALQIVKQNKQCIRKFKIKYYEDYDWLCGNSLTNKLNCWPCLLFSPESNIWSSVKSGYDDINNLHTAISRHEKSLSHINSYVDMKSFGKTERIDLLLDRQKSLAISKHNEQVSKNREILKRLIRITCFLGMQELPFRGHNEDVSSNNRGNYIELVNLLGEFDEKIDTHLKNATVFKGTSSSIQNELIEIVSTIMLEKIKTELNECMYVAILLDETSDVSCLSQLSTVIRYVDKSGTVNERFINFSDVSSNRCATAISDLSIKQLRELGCLDKLVAQTYDGAAVMSSELNGVQAKIRETVPQAVFLHCYAHKLNLVLSQSVSELLECNNFFSILGSLASFFSSSTKRTALLDEMVGKRFPKLAPTRWNYSGRLVGTVKENKDSLMDLLKAILEYPTQHDERTKNSARGLLAGINTFDFNFLLEVFSLIFPFTEYLYEVLQTKSMDIVFISVTVEMTLKKSCK